ncbi:MAG: hypothetical protein HY917_00825 [Candidatus Diapherotrites archaeon]|nr:hypothetical protein [Candidatus Diapherotrites archaeon]
MNELQKYGSWFFIIGVLLAVVAALLPWLGMSFPIMALLLAVLGLLVGLINVTDKEVTQFLVAAIALGVSSAALAPLSALPGMGFVSAVFSYIAVFVGPAAFVVALKAIYVMAKEA